MICGIKETVRIIILKTLALSVLTVPPAFAKTVNQVINNFVWRKKEKKHQKQTKKTMIGPKESGSLGMPDFDIINNVLQATWIRRQ